MRFVLLFFMLFQMGFSQSIDSLKVEKDTLVTRQGHNFIQPKNGITKDTLFNKSNDIEPRFVNCKDFLKKEDRQKCFSDIFYETLRKNIKFKNSWFKSEVIKFDVIFTINKIGKIENITFKNSNSKNKKFEKEILRVIKKMPKLLPGIKNGKPVKVKYGFPMKFSKPK